MGQSHEMREGYIPMVPVNYPKKFIVYFHSMVY
jgi:hypothetical protein